MFPKQIVYALMFEGKVVGYRTKFPHIGVADFSSTVLGDFGLKLSSVRGKIKLVEKGPLLVAEDDSELYTEVENPDFIIEHLRGNFESGKTEKAKDVFDMTLGDFILSDKFKVIEDRGVGIKRIVNRQGKMLGASDSLIDYPDAEVKRKYHKNSVMRRMLDGYPISYSVANSYGNDDSLSRNWSAINMFIEEVKYDTDYDTGKKLLLYKIRKDGQLGYTAVPYDQVESIINSSGMYQVDMAWRFLQNHGVPDTIQAYSSDFLNIDRKMGKGYACASLLVGALRLIEYRKKYS